MIEHISGDFLQWVRGFYYVASRGGVTQAASAMGQSQPTITRQIQRLEKKLGVTLFDRSSRQMQLTPEGQALLGKAISLFEIVKEINTQPCREEFQGRVTLASSHAILGAFLPDYIAEFRNAHPLVSFYTVGEISEAVIESVKSAETDFGICTYDSVPDSILCHELFESGTVLLTTKNSNLFNGKSPTLREVAKTPLILLWRAGSMEPYVVRRFAEAELHPNVVFTNNNPMVVKKYVAMGLGVALMSELTITKEDHRSFNIYGMDRYFSKRKYGLLIRKGKYLAPHVKAFIHSIKPGIRLD